ncbi:MAG: nucleotidyltransferase domain-containing protein [Anaerolineaceae bacterium]|nr:nucleotidyltransferase domain-containing protein [Anaerolineaceae bacterium]
MRLAHSIPQQALVVFCQRWKIRELALFGSILRADFRPDSDIDLLVTYTDDAQWGLFDHIQMKQELETILQRPVDFISRHALETSPNWIRREAILDTAKILYTLDEINHGA